MPVTERLTGTVPVIKKGWLLPAKAKTSPIYRSGEGGRTECVF
jgi:hypothetical protein